MEFLVRLEFDFPDQTTQDRIVTAERVAGNALQKEGRLVRIWRDPGRRGNWTLWNAKDSDEFHSIFSGLPAFPYFRNIQVFPLGAHPIDSGPAA